MAHLETRPGQPKMRHPGTFNANPLSAAAGVAALAEVATGEPCRRANDAARRLRRGWNEVFTRKGVSWIAYGDFSGFRLLHDYDGPRGTGDGFIPYNGDP